MLLCESSLDLNFPPFSKHLCSRGFVEFHVIKVAHLLKIAATTDNWTPGNGWVTCTRTYTVSNGIKRVKY